MYSSTRPRRRRRLLSALLVQAAIVSAIGVFGAGTAQANDIANFTTVFNTDVVHAGFGGMRDDGTGTLTVSGVSGTVTKAYLYWHGPTNSTDPTANAAVTFAGSPITGTNIGFSDNNCWGYTNSQAYRADVSSLVSGNGSYSLADFTKDSNNINVNGASLIVFFNDGNAANNRDVVLFDGNDSNITNTFDADGWNVSLPGITYTSGSANITLHVSDGQDFSDDALMLNSSQLVAAGNIFQGDSVPFGTFNSGGHLWDIKTYDVTSFLSPGPNTLTLTTGTASDCLSLVVAAIDLPAGAAPPPDKLASTLTVDPGTGDFADPTTVSATLKSTSTSTPLAGETVTLKLNATESCTGITNALGVASCSVTPGEAAGSYPLTGSFAGDSTYSTSTGSSTFAVTHEETGISYTGATSVVNGQTLTASATLTTDDPAAGTALAGKTVTFTLGSGGSAQTCSGTTNASGSASCAISAVSQTVGPVPITAAFAGDTFYQAAQTAASVNVFAPTAAGAFVIGDVSAGYPALGRSVNFWGAQWAKNNSFSGGAAPASMKGFADSPTTITCGATWTTRPGASSDPPATIPSQINVIVSSKVTKSGSTITGKVLHIVVVQVSPGYGPNPGHAGNGKIIGTVC